MSANKSMLKAMPKIDLHLHLLGGFSLQSLWHLSQKYQPNLDKKAFDQIFDFNNFEGFQKAWKFKNSLIKTNNDFSFLMDDFVKHLKKENIIYAEPAIALFELAPLKPKDLLDISFNKLKSSGIEFSFIMDLIRGDGLKEMTRQYEFYKQYAQSHQIRGVGLAGNEARHGLNSELAPLFKRAKQECFGITIHAGEKKGGDKNIILRAINEFGADRIGHAKHHLLHNKELGKNIHLELIPSAQSRWKADSQQYQEIGKEVSDYLNAEIYERMFGIDNLPQYSVNINSDDHGMYQTSLTEVMEKTATRISPNNWKTMNIMAITKSFAPEKIKQKLFQEIDKFDYHQNQKLSRVVKPEKPNQKSH